MSSPHRSCADAGPKTAHKRHEPLRGSRIARSLRFPGLLRQAIFTNGNPLPESLGRSAFPGCCV